MKPSLAVFAGLLAALPVFASTAAATGQQAEDRIDDLELRWWAQDAEGGVFDLALTPDGLLWAATGDGLLRLDGIETTRFLPGLDASSAEAASGRARPIHAVETDASGSLVVATDDGAYRFDGRRFVFLSRPGVGGRPWPARLLHLDRGRVLWVAAADTLLRLEPNAYSLRQGLPGVAVDLLWEDPFGHLWATTDSGQIFRRLGNAFQPVNFPLRLGNIKVQCLHLDSAGFLWLVRSDRAWRVDGDFAGAGLPRAARILESLSDLSIRTCTSEPDGGIWLGTGHGLTFRAADGSRVTVPGLDAEVRTILLARGGDLWVGTDRGILQLHDPSAEAPLPKVLVTSAWVDDEERPVGDTFDLEAGVDALRLRLSAPSFHQPSEVRLRYRWDEADADDADWMELDSTELLLHEVPTGSHTLTLQAGRGERWNEPGTELLIERAPILWQTRAFWGAVGAALAALMVWLLYLRWAGLGLAPMDLSENFDEDVVHLEDMDSGELRVSEETIERARRSIFTDDMPEDET